MGIFGFALADASRRPRHLALAAVGIVVGVALFAFFSALGSGVQQGVVNRMHPVDRAELRPSTADGSLEAPITEALLADLVGLPGVRGVHPRQKARFQGRVFGGVGILGRDVHAEALFDGLRPDLVRREMRAVEEGLPGFRRGADGPPCVQDAECGLARACVNSRCRDVLWADSFRDHGEVVSCASDHGCLSGVCDGGICTDTRPEVACHDGEPCPQGQACDGSGRCAAMRCVAGGEVDAGAWDRGVLVDWCADGPRGESASCKATRSCPVGTYCAPLRQGGASGHCERPMPAAVNPALVDMFNAAGAAALGVPRIAGPEALLGLRFQIRHGDSFLGTREAVGDQVQRWVEVVGFSDKALALGVTFPLPYVARANARYRGREAGLHPDSVLVQAASNEQLAGVVREAERRGLSLTPRSMDARSASRMLWVVTLVFQLIAALVLAMGLVNVAHVFRLLVRERRKELGVLRAVGATGAHVRRLVLVQSAALGLVAGALGMGFAWLCAWGVDGFLQTGGLLPSAETLFHWEWGWAGAIPAVALGCLWGAWRPASEAGHLELTEVLSPS